MGVPQARTAAILAAACVAGALGCATEDEAIPAGCLEGADAVEEALAWAPAPVRLDGTPLSSCLEAASDGGDLLRVGGAYLDTATRLATAAARRPDGSAATRLGYLMGAVRRADATGAGPGAELGRRLEQELARVDTDTLAFRRGERAGRRDG